ncbi:MAG: VanZ family protein [Anaerolineales bacterium]|nr:VanZ family protein [Anaerolineales bacterium]
MNPLTSTKHSHNMARNHSPGRIKMHPHRKLLLWIVTGLFIVTIAVIIIFADQGMVPGVIGMMYNYAWGDKLGHFILMGLLTFLVNLSLSARRVKIFSRPVLLGSILVTIAVVAEETSQLFLDSRSFSWLDLGSDLIGILCASWLISKICHLEFKEI